jgi:hypothetical protein
MPISREYQQYLETELAKRKPTLFEIICNQLGAKLPIDVPLDKETEQRMWQQIQFVGYKTTPTNVIRGSIAIFIASMLIGLSLLLVKADVIFTLMAFVGGALIALYWASYYLKQLVIFTRIRATPDLLLSVLYMVISLRITPNFENALIFAATNTGGLVGRDLKKIVWDLSIGKYESAEEGLEAFANKWKQENEEFSEAIDVLRTSMFKSEDERSKLYEEAINIILERNTDRMKRYTQELSNPIAIINYMGITLPVLTIILFPILTLFMSQSVPPYLLVVVYNVLLPIAVWWMINDTLMKRPISFGVRSVDTHPEAHRIGTMKIGKKTYKIWPFSLAIAASFVLLGLYLIYADVIHTGKEGDPITIQKVLGGMSIIWGAAGAIAFYSYFSYKGNDRIRDDMIQTENEFSEALFELGLILNSGYSVEASVEKLITKIKNLKIYMLFARALDNIRKFGHTFERAIFDPDTGVIKYYPSTMIRNILRVFSESLKKGSRTTATAMMSVSTYMKNVTRVENFLREMVSDTTSEMQFMMSLMIPVSMGVIIGLSALLGLILFQISQFFGVLAQQAIQLPVGDNSLLSVLGDIKRVVPIQWLTVIVGSYMIEVILSMAVLLSTLRNGEDSIEKHKIIAGSIFMGTIIFTIVGLVVFLVFRGLVSFV